jgi:hypothetical protein
VAAADAQYGKAMEAAEAQYTETADAAYKVYIDACGPAYASACKAEADATDKCEFTIMTAYGKYMSSAAMLLDDPAAAADTYWGIVAGAVQE